MDHFVLDRDADAGESSGFDGAVPDAGPVLDAAFYRRYYPDVGLLSDVQLEAHWSRHGRPEGRLPSWLGFLAAHEDFAAAIPADFSVSGYRLCNPDLDRLIADWEFVRHYVDHGAQEGRRYAIEPGSFVAEAYFDGERPDAAALAALVEAQCDGRAICFDMETLLARNGITSSAVLSAFDARFYRSAVAGLAGAPVARLLRHFAEEGLASLLPIAADHGFDAQFYAEFDETCDGLAPEDAYLRWLNDGLPHGVAPNAGVLLRALGLPDLAGMPDGFDPVLYRAVNPDLASLSRWDALRHVILHGIPEARPGCRLTRSSLALYLASANRLAEAGADREAATLFARILLLDPENTVAIRHIGDSLLRQGEWLAASRSYGDAIRLGRDNVWSHLNLAFCQERLGESGLACQTLGRLAAARPGDERVRVRLASALATRFDAAAEQVSGIAARGFHDEALTLMSGAMDDLVGGAREAAPLPQASGAVGLPEGRELRSVIILAETSLAQCRFYRVDQKIQQLERAGIAAQVFDRENEIAAFVQAIPFADAAIFYRVPAFPEIVEAILAARRAGLATYYDVDDPVFDRAIYPDTQESYGGLVGDAEYGALITGTALYRAAASLCEYGIASTPSLARRLEKVVESGVVHVHGNALSRSHLAVVPASRGRDDAVRIFYGSGTKAQNEDFTAHVAPALARLVATYGARVEIVIMGHLALPDSLQAACAHVRRIAPCWDLAAYWRILSSADINIAVLKPGPLADCKSEIKWLEAAIFAIPTIATDTATHRAAIEDGRTGLLVTDAEEWHAALDLLVRDRERRTAIGHAARDIVLEEHAIARGAQRLRAILASPAAVPVAAARRVGGARIRVLIVNVFYPPQAIGGATRVVADNVRDLRARHGTEIEIEVLTTTEGGAVPYALRVSIEDGVRVTAVTASDDADVDHRPHDSRMADIFERALDKMRPDLVHFHCIQRLSASLCGVAAARAIPYVITLHDGWWVSDHQFLLDAQGRLDVYDYADPLGCADGALLRASRLLPHLLAAKRLIAVSAPFAALHMRAGLPRVDTIENGLPALPTRARSSPPAGTVRLAYLGGICQHKGYDLLHAVVSRNQFANLRLTVIDHALEPGIEKSGLWGATPVRVRGKLPQAEIGALYAETDIILAPSIWPESYGLVAREAVAAGCRVIASDRGAIGLDLDDANGIVVDVSSQDGLAAALGHVDRHPGDYATPPAPAAPRQAAAQADELAALYRDIHAARGQEAAAGRSRSRGRASREDARGALVGQTEW